MTQPRAEFLGKLEIFIPGKPKTKDRPRAAVAKSGKPFMYSTRKTESEEKLIREYGYQFRGKMGWESPHTGPILLRCYFLIERPGNWYPGRFPLSKNYGDLDNYLKTVKDGLNGTVYRDDSQVVQYGGCAKVFWPFGGMLAVLEFYREPEAPQKGRKPRSRAGLTAEK